MAVTLQVREVREALYHAGSQVPDSIEGPGAPSTRLLGRLFHDVFTDLIGANTSRNLDAALADANADRPARQAALRRHAYEKLVGPRLRRHQALLHHVAPQVVSFWQAVEALCDWLAELSETAGRIAPAEPIEIELRDPRWTDAVVLTGIPDALVHIPGTDRWCVVELKLGRTSPEADLGQTCLYHYMLSQAHTNGEVNPAPRPSPGTLALVSFEPARQERLFEAEALRQAQQTLRELIGRLAGVLPESESSPEPESKPVMKEEPRPAEGGPKPEEPGHYQELGQRLVEVLAEYNAPVALDGPPIVGPTFLRFPVLLGPGVKLSAVQSRDNEIRVRLELEAPPRIGIERHRVVIDVQRPDRRSVLFSDIRGQLPAPDSLSGSSQVPLGVDLEGRLRLADLSQPEHAHILVAGTTGSGKSEWLRAAVAGLIVGNTPETLRLLLIDPKRNAFNNLRDCPFLFAPIVYPGDQPVSEVLALLADEMEARYRQLHASGSDALAEHVQRTGTHLPRIVCVCDEYADLLHQDRDERKAIEKQITRLGSKARAAGIHLILATQQPSREIVHGVLNANIPARVALKTNSPIESRMVLNQPGAEALLGRGDLLFKDIGHPVRLQSAYLPPEERGIFGIQTQESDSALA